MQDNFFDEHRFGCVISILATCVFGIAGIYASVFSHEVRCAVGLEKCSDTTNNNANLTPTATVDAGAESSRHSRTPAPSPTPTGAPTQVIVAASPTLAPPSTRFTPVVEDSPKPPPARAPARIENDVGRSKSNAYYEITVENAWISSRPGDVCSSSIRTGERAIVVRFAIRRSSPSRTAEESMRFGYTQTTDFVVVDDQNRRIEPSCGLWGIVLGEDRPVTRTISYLVPADSQHVMFRFQKSGGGDPIVFDLSGLN